MKSTAVVAALFAGLALATPVKRDIVTEWDIETVTVYVTATATASTEQVNTVAPTIVPTVATPAAPAATSSTAVVVAPAASSSTNSDGIDYSQLSAYAVPILKQHNIHRLNHSVPALQWDDELADYAQQIAQTCVYAHSNAAGDGDYGQNIGAGTPDTEVDKMITDAMYNGEYSDYPGYGVEPDMTHFEEWGHFSQIVWKNTLSVGCYTQKCATLANVGSNVAPYFTVCNYKPPGNYGGEYAANVLKPIGMETVVV